MAITIFNGNGTPSALVTAVVDKLTELGINCAKGSAANTVLINKWNNIENVEIPVTGLTATSTKITSNFAIRTDAGKEFFMALNSNVQTMHGSLYPAVVAYNNGTQLIAGSSSSSNYLPIAFEVPAGLYAYKDSVRIAPCLLFGSSTETEPLDIAEIGLYHADALLSPNAVYKSGNKEFVAINQFFLLKR